MKDTIKNKGFNFKCECITSLELIHIIMSFYRLLHKLRKATTHSENIFSEEDYYALNNFNVNLNRFSDPCPILV